MGLPQERGRSRCYPKRRPSASNSLGPGSIYRATGAAQLELCALMLLADVLLVRGEVEAAESALEILDTGKLGTGCYFVSETWRVAATVSLARGEAREETLAKIGKAVNVARQQGATMLELRAFAWEGRVHAREETARLRELQSRVHLAGRASMSNFSRVPSARRRPEHALTRSFDGRREHAHAELRSWPQV